MYAKKYHLYVCILVYANAIERTQNQYLQEAKALLAGGNREKAQVLMSKKKLVEKEVSVNY